MEVPGEAMIVACYTCDANFHDLEELRETGTGEGPVEPVNALLCDLLYNVRCLDEFEGTSYDVFGPNGMDDLCNLATMLTKPGGHGRVSCLLFNFLRGGQDFSPGWSRKRSGTIKKAKKLS